MASATIKKKLEKVYTDYIAEAEHLDVLEKKKQETVGNLEIVSTLPPGYVNIRDLAQHIPLNCRQIEHRMVYRPNEVETLLHRSVKSDGRICVIRYYRIPGTTAVDWGRFNELLKDRTKQSSSNFPIGEFTLYDYSEQAGISYKAAHHRVLKAVRNKQLKARYEKRKDITGKTNTVGVYTAQ